MTSTVRLGPKSAVPQWKSPESAGFAAGFFTGHQTPGQCGWIGIAPHLVRVFDVDDATVAASKWAFTDVNIVPWAQAARCATDICLTATTARFAGGFFSGHQLPNARWWLCVRPDVIDAPSASRAYNSSGANEVRGSAVIGTRRGPVRADG
jgi:hypothetical protein